MTYSAGTNNLIIDELNFQIDSSIGEVILIIPSIADYVGSGTGVFNKTVTYTFDEIGTSPNGFIYKNNPIDNKKFIEQGTKSGTFQVTVSGTYDKPLNYSIMTTLNMPA